MNARLIGIFGLVIFLGAFFYIRTQPKAPPEITPVIQPPVPEPTPLASPVPVASTTASPMPSATPKASTSDASPEQLKQFNALSEEIKAALPSQKDLQGMSDEQVHFTPPVIVKAGLEVGKMRELIAANPALATQGLSFYRDCAESDTYPNSIRASCFADFSRLTKSSGKNSAAPNVPERISKLADKIL